MRTVCISSFVKGLQNKEIILIMLLRALKAEKEMLEMFTLMRDFTVCSSVLESSLFFLKEPF